MNFDTDLNLHSRDELLTALEDVQRQVHETCAASDAEAFFRRPENAWSGADHLAHLAISVHAVAKGLAMRRFVLRLLFGRGSGVSRSFMGLRQTYREQLARGGRASGRFVPAQEEPPAGAAAARAAREALLSRFKRASGRLEQGLESWDEVALDHYRLPHPLLGKLTVREMLLFTIYHNLHHAQRVHEFHQINC